MRILAALVTAALLAACAGSGQSAARPSPSAAATLRNPLGFPLYPGAAIVATRKFTQIVQADTTGDALFTDGNGTYTGREVIARSPQPFADLIDWIDRMNASPPPGYGAVESGGNPDQRMRSQRYGLDYAAFTQTIGAKKRGLLVVVMDPKRVDRRFGVLLGLIGKYRALPAFMRAPIDNQAKAQIGMTISQATAPQSPIGAALTALGQFKRTHERGILLIEAGKTARVRRKAGQPTYTH